jgi:hypothetical protein
MPYLSALSLDQVKSNALSPQSCGFNLFGFGRFGRILPSVSPQSGLSCQFAGFPITESGIPFLSVQTISFGLPQLVSLGVKSAFSLPKNAFLIEPSIERQLYEIPFSLS